MVPNQKYTATCVHCGWLLYEYGGERYTLFSEAYCYKKKEMRCGASEICEQFVLRSGMHTNKTYPKNNTNGEVCPYMYFKK